jgi:hypothetical protein
MNGCRLGQDDVKVDWRDVAGVRNLDLFKRGPGADSASQEASNAAATCASSNDVK